MATKLTRTILLPTGLAMTLGCGHARAADPVRVVITLREHRFQPPELHVPAGVPVVIEVHNEDPTAEEFDSTDLGVEKVIAGGRQAPVRIRPLAPGRYAFIGEYHAETAAGVLVVDPAS